MLDPNNHNDPEPIPLWEESTVPPAPQLPGEVVLRQDQEDTFSALAADLMVHAQSCVRAFGDFQIALNASANAQAFYLRLMTDPAYRAFPWKRTHVWVTDEQADSHNDEGSTASIISEWIGRPSGLPRNSLHIIESARPDAAKRYERSLQQHLAWRERGHDRLDFVLAHIDARPSVAGLVGPSGGAIASEQLVSEGRDGVTLTLKALRGARLIALLATGVGRNRDVQSCVLGDKPASTPSHPIHHITPSQSSQMRWYIDHAAAATDLP